jgi:small GTP-binding protein
VLLGFPSVGKSTLLNALTNSDSKVAAYAFTTLTVIPGTLDYNQAKIQILDVPGIVSGAASGTGRGKEVLSVMRSADLVLLLIEVLHPEHLEVLQKEIFDVNLRLNQTAPDVTIFKTARGGISIGATVKLSIDEETIKEVLREFRITNAQVVIRSNITVDQLIDVISKNRIYLPSITIINKMDLVDFKIDIFDKIREEFKDFAAKLEVKDIVFFPISALHGDNVVEHSEKMPWYKGAPLLAHLEEVYIDSDQNFIDCRFPVQWVIRPQSATHHDYRGYGGRVASGIFKKGNDITVLPSGFTTKIKRIESIKIGNWTQLR